METYTIQAGSGHNAGGDGAGIAPLESLVPTSVAERLDSEGQRAIPGIAKEPALTAEIEQAVRQVATTHTLFRGDARSPLPLADGSVHLVVTSPPYWTLKQYEPHADQLGEVEDYENFLDQLDLVWQESQRLLVPGGRLVVVVGDVCLSRRKYGRHVVFPLHASIQERCRKLGFDNLAPIIWHKISNAATESKGNGSTFLGKPYEPNAIIKHDIEYVLFERKPGGYRKPTPAMRALSLIPADQHRAWYQQIWNIGGASTRRHPAPYPLSVAERLVRMFSFVGDTVFDPFSGTGTTALAAGLWGRNSVSVEVEPSYMDMAISRLRTSLSSQIPLLSSEVEPVPSNLDLFS